MYYELLSKMRNAERARKHTIRMPYSNMDFEVAKILVEEKFIKEVKKKTFEKKNFLEIELPSYDDESHIINDFTILSKPSRRFYVGYRGLRLIRQGYGIGVLSTPRGIMTNAQARKNKLGGEYLFNIW